MNFFCLIQLGPWRNESQLWRLQTARLKLRWTAHCGRNQQQAPKSDAFQCDNNDLNPSRRKFQRSPEIAISDLRVSLVIRSPLHRSKIVGHLTLPSYWSSALRRRAGSMAPQMRASAVLLSIWVHGPEWSRSRARSAFSAIQYSCPGIEPKWRERKKLLTTMLR